MKYCIIIKDIYHMWLRWKWFAISFVMKNHKPITIICCKVYLCIYHICIFFWFYLLDNNFLYNFLYNTKFPHLDDLSQIHDYCIVFKSVVFCNDEINITTQETRPKGNPNRLNWLSKHMYDLQHTRKAQENVHPSFICHLILICQRGTKSKKKNPQTN